MEFIKALESVKAEGPFLLLTERNVEAFRDLNECNERTAVLGLEPFAVVTLLWTGGPKQTLDPGTNDSELYRLHEKRETIATLKTVATPKQPQPAPKREEKKRLPIVLGDATIRGSLQEIVNCLGAADLAQAKEALIALDFSRLLRTVTDSSQPGWRPAADILPTLGVYRVRVVGDYLSNLTYYLDSGDAEAAAEEAQKALKNWN